MAGRQIMQALIAEASRAGHIEILENSTALEAVAEGGQVAGIVVAKSAATVRADLATAAFLPASAVVLATGGIGRLYAVTTNAADARGEGIGIAARVGATIADAEFVQFHPTAIDVGRDPAPLATEALRGEGAILVNGAGERFMTKIHPDAELGPRDVVARAVFAEVASGRGAFLDCRTAIGARMKEAFPTVYGFCAEAGIDPAAELIPVAPAAHYHMGGVLTDANGRTGVEGLWACGEVASTGAHGANRLASNSLLEAVVFGARIAEDIRAIGPLRLRLRLPRGEAEMPAVKTGFLTADETTKLRRLMSGRVGVVRDAAGLTSAVAELGAIAERAASGGRMSNMLLSARLMAATALAREESRGGHYRSDFPEENPSLARRSYARFEDGRIELMPLVDPGAGVAGHA
jgi:L-aspartate oxidase